MKNYAKCTTLPLGAIHAESFLKEQLLRSKHGMGGHLPELEPGMIADPFLRKTFVKSWEPEKQAGWGAEISGNYYAGLIQLAYTLDDGELKTKAAAWVDAFLKMQQPDGYLGTYTGPDANIYEDYNAWGTARGMRALLFYYEATGREDVFDAVYRCMLWFARTWAGDRKTTYAAPVILEPVLYCYHKTGDAALLKFAQEYEEFLCTHTSFDNSYLHLSNPKFKYLGNHTGAYGDDIRLPALVYSATGEEKYLNASRIGIQKIMEKGTQLTGGPVSFVEYTGPIGAVNETEYCCFTYFNTSYITMAAITGEAIYGDYSEQIVYNGSQGAKKKDERAIAYLSAPNQIFATTTSAKAAAFADMQVYAPCYPVACCPVNSVNVLPEFIRGMAMEDTDGNLYLSAYGPCRIRYRGWEIREKTLYPFNETIDLEISGMCGRKLFCKIPVWSKHYQILVDEKAVDLPKNENGFVCIEGASHVRLIFEANVEVVHVDDSDCSKKYPLAFRRGALLYALKIDAQWEPFYPETETPLPKQWPWYNVRPVPVKADGADFFENQGLIREKYPWNVAVDETLRPEQIRVERCGTDGYPWEEPYIRLHVPAYRAPMYSAPYPIATFEPLEDRLAVTTPLELTLVPYGATNLRITYFPRADLEAAGTP